MIELAPSSSPLLRHLVVEGRVVALLDEDELRLLRQEIDAMLGPDDDRGGP